MKREIKFRVFNGIEMTDNVIAGKFGVFFVNPGAKQDGLDEKDTASLTPFNTKYHESTPVMEFIGIKDVKGIEIYEGDIVIITGHGIRQPFEVRHFAPSFHILCVPTNVHIPMSMNSEYEVIGNIYQNPELLVSKI